MFLDLVKKRRSIRRYSTAPLAETQIRGIIGAALLSPSSRGLKPWELVLIKDKDTLHYLSETKHGATMIATASVAVVILGDTETSDVWIEDCSIVASNVLLAAADLGIGACWVQIRGRSHSDQVSADTYVRSRLGIPDRYRVEAIISLGNPGEKKAPLEDMDMPWEKVHEERYTSPDSQEESV